MGSGKMSSLRPARRARGDWVRENAADLEIEEAGVSGKAARAPSARLAHAGIHPPGAAAEGFLDQRQPDAAAESGHQDCLVCDCHYTLLYRWCPTGPVAALWRW